MALNPEFVGRVYGPGEPYEVSRVKIADFADAVGEPSELCRDREAAVKAGYPDVIAPPTFAVVISMQAADEANNDPGLGLDYSMVVHGEQRFEHSFETEVLGESDVRIAQEFGFPPYCDVASLWSS